MTAKLKQHKNFLHLFIALITAGALVYVGFFLASNRVQADHNGDTYYDICNTSGYYDPLDGICDPQGVGTKLNNQYCGQLTFTCSQLCGQFYGGGATCCAPVAGWENFWFGGTYDYYHAFYQGTCGSAAPPAVQGNFCQFTSYGCDVNEPVTLVSCECVSGGGGGSGPSVNLVANPTSVSSGGSSTLTWTVSGGTPDTCTASGGWSGSKNISGGSEVVTNIIANTTFTITCLNTDGSSSDSATVNVTNSPPVVDLTASPTSVASGGSSTLTWTVVGGASGCTAGGGWSGAKSPSGGSQVISGITATTNYWVTCSNAYGSDTDSALVTVVVPQSDLIISDFHLTDAAGTTKSSFVIGEAIYPSVTIRNTGTGPTTVGSFYVSIYSNAPSAVAAGTGSDVGIWVTETSPIAAGASKTYSITQNVSQWSATNWNKGVASSYTARAYVDSFNQEWNESNNGNNQATSAYTVTTVSAPTVTLTASPTTVNSGQTTTLTWSSTNATSCTAAASPSNAAWSGAKATSGSQASSALTADTTFSLTCTGPGGSGSAAAVVNVNTVTYSYTFTPNTLTFSVAQNAAAPASQNYTVTNTGNQNLNFTAWDNVTWGTVSPSSFSLAPGASQFLAFTITDTSLSPGTYFASVATNDANAGLKINGVSYTVNPPPAGYNYTVSPASLSFSAIQGAPLPASQVITVTNTDNQPLNINVSDNASWMDVAPASFGLAVGASQNVTVSINTTGMALGTYNGTVSFSEANAGNRSVSVSYVITSTCVGNGSGTGLLGDYFNSNNLNNYLFSRRDPNIQFSWGAGNPGGGLGNDNYSVRWRGKVEARCTETYTFYTYSDDGMRLWVNGTQVVNDWTDHAPVERVGSPTLSLVAGQKYDIVAEYYEKGGGAVAEVRWSSPSTPKQAIPATQLFPLPSADLKIDGSDGPVSKNLNQTANITWSSTDATSCTAASTAGDFTGAKSTSGSAVTSAINTSPRTYSLTCTGTGGTSATDSVTVSVPAPTVNFSANPTTVIFGGTSDITWSTSNATNCSTSGGTAGWPSASKGLSGTETSGGMTANTTFNISCSGPGGTTNRSVTVTVLANPDPDVDVDITAVNGSGVSSLARIKDGDRLDFTVTFRNNPGAGPATEVIGDVTLSNNLTSPSNFTCVSCNGGTLNDNTFSSYRWNGTLASGVGSVQLRFSANVDLQTNQLFELMNVRLSGVYDPNDVPYDVNYSLIASPLTPNDPGFIEVAP